MYVYYWIDKDCEYLTSWFVNGPDQCYFAIMFSTECCWMVLGTVWE